MTTICASEMSRQTTQIDEWGRQAREVGSYRGYATPICTIGRIAIVHKIVLRKYCHMEGIQASESILDVLGATDHDWRALECTRGKDFPPTTLQRTTPWTVICRFWIQQLHPAVLIGHACRSITETGLEETRESARAAVSLIHTFVDSPARLLVLQCTSHLPRSPE